MENRAESGAVLATAASPAPGAPAPEEDRDWSALGFPVNDHPFDQKNEMFKRPYWDGSLRHVAERFYKESPYSDKPGWTKDVFLVRGAAWHMEWSQAMGNSLSNHGLYSWEGLHPKMERFAQDGGQEEKDPGQAARLVKQAALTLGADLVGIAPVHPSWIYSHEFNLLDHSHKPLDFPWECRQAVVMAVAMDYDLMRSAALPVEGITTGLGYSRMAVLASSLAAFIRALGYRALPSGNDTGLSIPLALAAGLGEWSRMGLLVTQKFGPRVRLCKVFTDLPLTPDSYRPFGVVEFCETCKTCAEQCPSQAIPKGGPTTQGPNISSHSGPRKWYVDCERCFGYWSRRKVDCTNCIRVCPFNKPQGAIHDLTRSLIRRKNRPLNRAILWGDRLLGYDRPYPARRFFSA